MINFLVTRRISKLIYTMDKEVYDEVTKDSNYKIIISIF